MTRPTLSIPLSQGYEAIIDAEDEHLIAGRPWHAQVVKGKYVYASHLWTQGIGAVRSYHRIYMHQLIADAAKAPIRRPLNKNALDCRKVNFGCPP